MKSLSLSLTFAGIALAAAVSTSTAGPIEHDVSLEEAAPTATELTDLEKVFWTCDYVGTKQGVDMNTAATCGAATDELKRIKFGGDFEKLVAWWQLNKAAEHKAVERDSAANASSEDLSEVEFPDSI